MIMWSLSHVTNKTFFVRYQSALGYQTLSIKSTIQKVTSPFDHVGDHVTNRNRYISNTTAPFRTKFGRMVT